MSTARPALLFLTLLLTLPALSVAAPAAAADDDDDELLILLNLISALNDSNPDPFSSWNPEHSKCGFAGISCDSDGAVTEIDLSRQRLAGAFPFDRVCRLKSLQRLSLGFNSLYGPISQDLNSCIRLQYLDVGNNLFTGAFPNISSLTGLTYLHLNSSRFSSFPWNSISGSLRVLSVGDNPLQRITFPVDVTKLSKLNWLYLNNCSIEGTIPPHIGDLTDLTNLELSDNFLSGPIPPEIGNLVNLRQLELYGNNITGKLPVGFRNLTKLENFDASQNKLQGDLSELRFLSNLISLQLFENQFTGEVPREFGDFRRLVNLSLYTNMLTGTLPLTLGSWAEFIFIDVSENFLTGPIPPGMCKQGTMKKLLMLQNNFSGEIPSSYANCSTLIRFRVNENSLSGVVPSGIWGLPSAEIIDVRSNRFEGSITPDIGRAKNLAQLFAANNQLTGELPPEISGASSLLAIDLSNNRFAGDIPPTIRNLKKLGSLILQNNQFSGSIPESIGLCTSLTSINIAHNSLSGKIPASLGSISSLNSLNLTGNELSGRIPSELSVLGLSLLDLSNNKLSGPIPKSLIIDAYNGSFAKNPGLCSWTVRNFRQCSSNSGISKEYRALIVCFVVAIVVLLVLLAVIVVRSKRRDHHYRDRPLKEGNWDVKSFHVLTFTENEILDSIKQENVIGKGGSGEVYKVALPNGIELAVKHIWNSDGDRRNGRGRSSSPMLKKGQRKTRELESEVEALSSIRHVNVVKLYCSITSEDSSLLVYEYMPNGSLWDRLHTCQKMQLDWDARYEIALGAAKGLEYLHHGCERPVIHRDVKSSNILLDEFLKPRIADFGLAKILQAHVSVDSTHIIAGTLGYFAPEYGYTYRVNEKSDVYSFGVVLMELVTGKRPIEPEYGENKNIVNWVFSELGDTERELRLVDSAIYPEALKEEAVKVLRISILCTARLPEQRPTMRAVVKMLEEAEPCKLVGVVVRKDKEQVHNNKARAL